MEKNTFATSAYIAAPPETVHEYLGRLENLDEWTLGSRMVEQIDEDTWIGTASGHQRRLVYHAPVRPPAAPRHRVAVAATSRASTSKAYPVLLFPPTYVDPDSAEPGAYLHWVSVIDPVKRTPMIMEGISAVHRSECRALKAALERRAGLTEAARGRPTASTPDTIYIDAPIDLAASYVGDARTMEQWSHLARDPRRGLARRGDDSATSTTRRSRLTFRTHRLGDYRLVEQNFYHPGTTFLQRCPVLLILARTPSGIRPLPASSTTASRSGTSRRHS